MSDLNDYIDGRMNAEERAAFERRLESDPSLERRVKEATEVRDALREDVEELPPGFMTRTVARFEEEQRPRARLPFGLTWSTAGLAVAGLAAAAIFLPLMFRGELTSQIQPAPTESADAAFEEQGSDPAGSGYRDAKDEASQLSQDQADAMKSLGYVAGAEDVEDGDLDSAATPETRNPVVAQPEPLPSFEPARADPETRSSAERPATRVGDSKASPSAGKLFSLSPPPPPAKTKRRQDNAPASAPVEVQPPPAQETATEADAVKTYRARGEGTSLLSASRGVAAMTLPDGFVDPETVKISGGASDQDSYTVHGNDDETTRERVDASGRFLLIGKRAGLDSCGELTLKETPTHWEVAFDESGSAEGSVGCGLLIPADDREIHFMGKRVDG